MTNFNNSPLSLGTLLREKLGYGERDRRSILMTVMRCTPNSIRARDEHIDGETVQWLQKRFILTAKELYAQMYADEKALDYTPVSGSSPFLRPTVPLKDGLCVWRRNGHVMFTHNVGEDDKQMKLFLISLGFIHSTISVKELRTVLSNLLDYTLISGYQKLSNVIYRYCTQGDIRNIQRVLNKYHGHP